MKFISYLRYIFNFKFIICFIFVEYFWSESFSKVSFPNLVLSKRIRKSVLTKWTISAAALAQYDCPGIKSQMTPELRKQFVDVHNRFRAMLTGGNLKNAAKSLLAPAGNVYQVVSFRDNHDIRVYIFNRIIK